MSTEPDGSMVSSIHLRAGQGGACRVFLVQTRNRAEVKHVQLLFDEVAQYCSVRPLALGVTTAFVIQSGDDHPMLASLEQILKEDFKFSMVHGGFNPGIHRIVEDLAMETMSHLYPLPLCGGCGCAEPFPVWLTIHRFSERRLKGLFCERCVSSACGDPQALCRLVDPGALKTSPQTSVVRKRSILRFGMTRGREREQAADADGDPSPGNSALNDSKDLIRRAS